MGNVYAGKESDMAIAKYTLPTNNRYKCIAEQNIVVFISCVTLTEMQGLH